MRHRRLLATRLLAVLLGFGMASFNLPAVFAATNGSPPVNLNLTSSSASVIAPRNLAGTSITVGNQTQLVVSGKAITPSEYVAALQVLSSGKQTIVINASGQATAGTFNLSPALGRLTAMVLPSNVTALDNTHTFNWLNIAGPLVNDGSVVATGNPGSTFRISSASLNVGATGNISSTNGVNLSIATSGDIVNSGSISSGANLLLHAGGSINNQAGGTISGATGATLFAGTGQITNAGNITAQTGNLVLEAGLNTPLAINNTAGVIQAELGAIQLGTLNSTTSQSTQVTGGDLLSQELNVYGGSGAVTINADNITGIINVDAGSSSVVATGTSSMSIGTTHVTGDPMFASNAPAQIASNQAISGQPMTVISGGDITVASGVTQISTASTTAAGGAITLIAGAAFTGVQGGANPIVITGGTTAGGQINLVSTAAPNGAAINSSTTASGAAAGNVELIAFPGTSASSGSISCGPINASSTKGAAGQVTALGANKTAMESINTSGKTAGGAIDIETGMQTGTTSLVGAPAYDATSGGFQSGSGSFVSGAVVATSSVALGGTIDSHATAGNGGDVTIRSADAANVNDPLIGGFQEIDQLTLVAINTSASQGTNKAGSVIVSSTGANGMIIAGGIDTDGPTPGSVTLFAQTSGVDVEGLIQSTSKGTGGVIVIDTGGSISLNGINNSGTQSGNNILLIANNSISNFVGITDTGKNNSSTLITITAATDNINFRGPIVANGSNGAGANLTMLAATDIVIQGAINVSGSATSSFAGGNVSITSNTSSVTIAGSINASGKHDGNESVSVVSSTGVEINGGITTSGSLSSGKITLQATTSGDVRVGFNPSNQIVNKQLVSSLLLGSLGAINAGSTQGIPGQVNITATAGNVYLAQGVNTAGNGSFGASGTITIGAGERVLIQGPVNSSDSGGAAGPISITESGVINNPLFGIDTGAINASGKTGGGSVALDSENGAIIVRGAINTNAQTGPAGMIAGNSLYDTTIQGGITAEGTTAGSLLSLKAGLTVGHVSQAGILTIDGSVNASGLSGAPGSGMFLFGQTGLTINGNLISTGLTGGTIICNSNDGVLTVTGNINSSSNNGAAPGNAGAVMLNYFGVNIYTGSAVIVKGNITAKGGNATGDNPGGKGGSVQIATSLDLATNTFIGNTGPITVGSIDTQGGNTVKNGTHAPGTGGLVQLLGDTVQLTNSAAGGGSVNASGGTGGTGPALGGQIQITTWGLQPIPTNLNLLSSKTTEVALPGTVFTAGSAKVDGSAGKLISSTGAGPDVFKPQAVLDASITSTGGRVTVSANLTFDSYNQGIPHAVDAGVNNNDTNAVYTMITPSQALALYQTTRNGIASQTFGLTSNATASNLANNGVPGNVIIIQLPTEMSKQYSSFVLSTGAGNPANELTFVVKTSDNNPSVFLGMPSSGATIAQTLRFSDIFGTMPAIVDLQAGKGPLTVASDGEMDTLANLNSPITFNFFSSGSMNIVNNGTIQSEFLNFRSPGTATVTAGINSVTTTTASAPDTLNISGSLGLAKPTGTFNFLSSGNGSTPASLTSASAQVLEGNLKIAGAKSSSSLAVLNLTVDTMSVFGSISITGSGDIVGSTNGFLQTTGNITLNVPTILFFTHFNEGAVGQISVNTATLDWLGAANMSAGGNVSLITRGIIADNNQTVDIKSINGTLVIGNTGQELSPQISFTNGGDEINSSGNLTIFGAGTTGITLSGRVGSQKGNVQLGGAPKFNAVAQGTDDYKAEVTAFLGSVNVTGGPDSVVTLRDVGATNGQITGTFNGTSVTYDDLGAKSISMTSTCDATFDVFSHATATQGNLSIHSAGTIVVGDSSALTAGELPRGVQSVPGNAPVLKTALASTGNIDLEGQLGVIFDDTSTPTATPNVQSFGGNVLIRSTNGGVTLGQKNSFAAFGGNLSILGETEVIGGASAPLPTGTPGNEFSATGLQTGKNVKGGGIEILSGTTTSIISGIESHLPKVSGNLIDPGQPPFIFAPANLTLKYVLVGAMPGVNIAATLNGTNGAALTGTNPIVIINSAAPGTQVFLDSVVINSVTSIGYEEQHDGNDLVVDSAVDAD